MADADRVPDPVTGPSSDPSSVATDLAVGGLDTPVGQVSVAVSGMGLARVGWGRLRTPAGRPELPVVDDGARVAPVLTQLAEYFRGERRTFDLPIDWRFTSTSQRAVLRILFDTVGYGALITYGELAERSGSGVPARGIGSVMGSNPLPLVVPCHRVVGHDGLGGYSGGSGGNGLAVKRWLLTMEGALTPTLDWDPDRLSE